MKNSANAQFKEFQNDSSYVISVEAPSKEYRKLYLFQKIFTFLCNVISLAIAAAGVLVYTPVSYVLIFFVDCIPMPKNIKSSINGLLKVFVVHCFLTFFSFLVSNKIYAAQDSRIAKRDKGIVISNHLCDFDWLFLGVYFRMVKKLKYMFVVMKEPLSRIPLVGYIIKKMGHVFVKRNIDLGPVSSQPLEVLQKSAKLIDGMKKGFLLIFPEGTYMHGSAHQKSIQYLEQHPYEFEGGQYIPRNVLTPKESGFNAILNSLNSLEGIIDLTIFTNPFTKNLDDTKNVFWHMLFGSREFSFVIVADFIPQEQIVGSPRYLQEIFCEKDKLISRFEQLTLEKSAECLDSYKIRSSQELEEFLLESRPNISYEYRSISFYSPYWPLYILLMPVICLSYYNFVVYLVSAIHVLLQIKPLQLLRY